MSPPTDYTPVPLVFDGWSLTESVRVNSPIRTPLGGSVTLLSCTVDITYSLESDHPMIRSAQLTLDERGIANVASTQTGECSRFEVSRPKRISPTRPAASWPEETRISDDD